MLKASTDLRFHLARRICRVLPPIVAGVIRERLFPLSLARIDNRHFEGRSHTGVLYRGRIGEYHSYRLCMHGFNDWRVISIARVLCSPGDSIIEVGANVGTETLFFSAIVKDQGHVYAFEPLPDNVRMLRSLFGDTRNVLIHDYALGKEHRTVSFSIPPTDNSGTGHIVADASSTDERLIDVRCLTLDSQIGEIVPPVSFMHLDAEGAELDVLLGAQRLIESQRPRMILEVQTAHMNRFGYRPADLFSQLRLWRYEVHRIAKLGLQHPDLTTRRLANWLCVPEEDKDLIPRVKRALVIAACLPCIPGISPVCCTDN